MTNALIILKNHKLSITGSRQKIMELFLASAGALSHADIEKNTGAGFDRVTIYRTLQSFVESGIIHLIPTTDNSIKYALCKDDCQTGHHHDNHVHVVCDECKQTTCLDEVVIPIIKLPKGFTPHQSEMMVSGICKDCK
ncbi:MAG: transcriptional repressor [Ginsengibacter sp.]